MKDMLAIRPNLLLDFSKKIDFKSDSLDFNFQAKKSNYLLKKYYKLSRTFRAAIEIISLMQDKWTVIYL